MLALTGKLPLYTSKKINENQFNVAIYLGEKFLAEGTGKSKRCAEKEAAEKALELNLNYVKGELNVN